MKNEQRTTYVPEFLAKLNEKLYSSTAPAEDSIQIEVKSIPRTVPS